MGKPEKYLFRYIYQKLHILLLVGCLYGCMQGLPITIRAQQSLSEYLSFARQRSPLLKDYANQLAAAQLDSLLIRAAHKPQVFASGMLMAAPTFHGYGYDMAITNGGQYTALASVSQPLFTRKILQPQFAQLDIQRQQITNNAHISTYDLEHAVALQYLVAYADQLLLEQNRRIDSLLQQQQMIVQRLVQQGVYQYADYLNITVALQNQEITLDQLRTQYLQDLSALRYLCGIADTGIVYLQEPDITLHEPPTNLSVFLRRYQLDSLSIVNQRQLFATHYLPTINWFADAGFNASQLSTAYKNFGTSFGISLNIPIYDGHQRRLQNEKLDLQERTRQQYQQFFTTQYHQQISGLYQQLRETSQQILSITQKLATSEELLTVDRQLVQTGNIRITDYLMAIQQHLMVQTSLDQARIRRWQVITELNYWLH
ncbi:TolC family protein [Thermoflavifilum thermophilum]|uniref:Outer membrane protein TolC n=1 Tax=Thermoflavifilum thermophilum TaxID=1393122 RepID=A0A1I7N2B2_9BACT|nr:TolC family protein [Thermoflavifilum thermophilum]SFV28800.1 Outer membrane protein TolC [Thermoflavifilum thermophilum]